MEKGQMTFLLSTSTQANPLFQPAAAIHHPLSLSLSTIFNLLLPNKNFFHFTQSPCSVGLGRQGHCPLAEHVRP